MHTSTICSFVMHALHSYHLSIDFIVFFSQFRTEDEKVKIFHFKKSVQFHHSVLLNLKFFIDKFLDTLCSAANSNAPLVKTFDAVCYRMPLLTLFLVAIKVEFPVMLGKILTIAQLVKTLMLIKKCVACFTLHFLSSSFSAETSYTLWY